MEKPFRTESFTYKNDQKLSFCFFRFGFAIFSKFPNWLRKFSINFYKLRVKTYTNFVKNHKIKIFICLYSVSEIPGPAKHSNTEYKENIKHSEKYNTRNNENNKGFLSPSKNNNIANNTNYLNDFSSNRSLTVHYQYYVKVVFGYTAIIVTTSVNKFLIPLWQI